MVYLAYYSKPGKPFLMRVITRGFACTRSELRREIEIRCGQGAQLSSYEGYSSEEAVRAIIPWLAAGWTEEADQPA